MLAPIDDFGAIYVAHLLAGVEQSIPTLSRESQIAATWLMTEAAREGGRLWKVVHHDLAVSGTSFGGRRTTIRTASGHGSPISLARRSWLRDEGYQIFALAAPFREERDPNIGRNNLVAACVAQLASESPKAPVRADGLDARGIEIHLVTGPVRPFQGLFNIFLSR